MAFRPPAAVSGLAALRGTAAKPVDDTRLRPPPTRNNPDTMSAFLPGQEASLIGQLQNGFGGSDSAWGGILGQIYSPTQMRPDFQPWRPTEKTDTDTGKDTDGKDDKPGKLPDMFDRRDLFRPDGDPKIKPLRPQTQQIVQTAPQMMPQGMPVGMQQQPTQVTPPMSFQEMLRRTKMGG